MPAVQTAMTPTNRRKSRRVAIPRRSIPRPIKTYSGRSPRDAGTPCERRSLRERGALPRLCGEMVVRESANRLLRHPCPRKLLDPARAEDPVVDPPQFPLLDVDLLLAGPQEPGLLEHVEHVPVVHVEAVFGYPRGEPQKRQQGGPQGGPVPPPHPPLPRRPPAGGPPIRPPNQRHRGRPAP